MGLAPVVQRLSCAIHQLKLLPISCSFGGSVQEAVIANITKTTIFISTDLLPIDLKLPEFIASGPKAHQTEVNSTNSLV